MLLVGSLIPHPSSFIPHLLCLILNLCALCGLCGKKKGLPLDPRRAAAGDVH
jgi:hypothetical protein